MFVEWKWWTVKYEEVFSKVCFNAIDGSKQT